MKYRLHNLQSCSHTTVHGHTPAVNNINRKHNISPRETNWRKREKNSGVKSKHMTWNSVFNFSQTDRDLKKRFNPRVHLHSQRSLLQMVLTHTALEAGSSICRMRKVTGGRGGPEQCSGTVANETSWDWWLLLLRSWSNGRISLGFTSVKSCIVFCPPLPPPPHPPL